MSGSPGVRKSGSLSAIVIRRARAADAADLTALDQRSFPVADRFSLRVWRHLLGSAARQRSAVTVLAERDGVVIGSANALLRRGSRVLRLYTLAVDPAARGLGLASRLLVELLAECPRRCTVFSLEVRADNPARTLYERWGLRVVAELPGYYRDGAAGVRMRGERAAVARILAQDTRTR